MNPVDQLSSGDKNQLHSLLSKKNLAEIQNFIKNKNVKTTEEISVKGFGWSVLHYAAHFNSGEVMDYLLEKTVEQYPDNPLEALNVRSSEGYTPAFVACIYNCDAALDSICRKGGIYLLTKDETNQTMLDQAKKYSATKCINIYNNYLQNNNYQDLLPLAKIQEIKTQYVQPQNKEPVKVEAKPVVKKVEDKPIEKNEPEKVKPQEFEDEKTKQLKPRKMKGKIDELSKEINYEAMDVVSKTSLSDESYLKSNYDEKQLKVIGKGGFGEVYMGTKKDGSGKFAIKVIETLDSTQLNQSIQELMNLSRLKNHPNIMSYENYFLNPVALSSGKTMYQIFIEMELAHNSLHNIVTTKGFLTENEIHDITGQLLSGLNFAHEHQCVHLDLKPENILIANDTCKISDWGGSLILKSSTTTKVKSKGIAVTKGYVAPEIDSDTYGQTETINYYLCDVYSLGMLLFRLCGVPQGEITGIPKNKKKFHDATIEEFIETIEKRYSKKLLDFISKMTSYEPKDRPSISEAINIYKSF